MKSCLPSWINEWLGKIQWNFITWKIRFIEYDADHAHGKRVCENLKIKNSWDYHDFYVQSEKLLLAVAFGSFQKMYLEIYEFDHALFFWFLAYEAALKRTNVRLDFITDIDTLLMV